LFDIKGHVKNTFIMKTATAQDLLFRLPMVLGWLESGEEVMVKPKASDRPTQESTAPAADLSQSAALAVGTPRVNQSVVFKRPRFAALDMAQEELQDFYADMRGSY
jgi:hypothetical protein